MFYVQEMVDDLLVPKKFPVPTICKYLGGFPTSIEMSERRFFHLNVIDTCRIIWWFRLRNHSGRMGTNLPSYFKNKMWILVEISSSSIRAEQKSYDSFFKKFDKDVTFSFWGGALNDWQNFIAEELPQWFEEAKSYQLIPMGTKI